MDPLRKLAELFDRGRQLHDGAVDGRLAASTVPRCAPRSCRSSAISRCCAPSCRLRSRRRRASSAAATIRARERRTSASWRLRSVMSVPAMSQTGPLSIFGSTVHVQATSIGSRRAASSAPPTRSDAPPRDGGEDAVARGRALAVGHVPVPEDGPAGLVRLVAERPLERLVASRTDVRVRRRRPGREGSARSSRSSSGARAPARAPRSALLRTVADFAVRRGLARAGPCRDRSGRGGRKPPAAGERLYFGGRSGYRGRPSSGIGSHAAA